MQQHLSVSQLGRGSRPSSSAPTSPTYHQPALRVCKSWNNSLAFPDHAPNLTLDSGFSSLYTRPREPPLLPDTADLVSKNSDHRARLDTGHSRGRSTSGYLSRAAGKLRSFHDKLKAVSSSPSSRDPISVFAMKSTSQPRHIPSASTLRSDVSLLSSFPNPPPVPAMQTPPSSQHLYTLDGPSTPQLELESTLFRSDEWQPRGNASEISVISRLSQLKSFSPLKWSTELAPSLSSSSSDVSSNIPDPYYFGAEVPSQAFACSAYGLTGSDEKPVDAHSVTRLSHPIVMNSTAKAIDGYLTHAHVDAHDSGVERSFFEDDDDGDVKDENENEEEDDDNDDNDGDEGHDDVEEDTTLVCHLPRSDNSLARSSTLSPRFSSSSHSSATSPQPSSPPQRTISPLSSHTSSSGNSSPPEKKRESLRYSIDWTLNMDVDVLQDWDDAEASSADVICAGHRPTDWTLGLDFDSYDIPASPFVRYRKSGWS